MDLLCVEFNRLNENFEIEIEIERLGADTHSRSIDMHYKFY